MFTGIVQGKASVSDICRETGILHLTLDCGSFADGVVLGASVAVAGTCLTVVAAENGRIVLDLIDETLQKTTLRDLKVGDSVNFERSARAGDEIGGHRVSGHVTGIAEITKLDTPPNNKILTIKVNPEWMQYIFLKGFIALDGCSLTVVDVGPDWFTVHLIPETLRLTTFGEKLAGNKVNLELDPETVTIVETVKRMMERQHSGS